jgi:glycogen debranching enzyme
MDLQSDIVASTVSAATTLLHHAQLTLRGAVVGTVAARDDTFEIANYGECFIRDFAVTAAAWLPDHDTEAIAAFLRTVAEVQATTTEVDVGLRPADGLIPASFSVHQGEDGEERIVADFGQRAIGRVVPVDSALWWLFILRAYVHATGDDELARSESVQHTIERILALYLRPQF